LSSKYLDYNLFYSRDLANDIELYIKERNFEPFDLFYNFYRKDFIQCPHSTSKKYLEKAGKKLDSLIKFLGQVKNQEYFKVVVSDLLVPFFRKISKENKEEQISMISHVLEHLPSDFNLQNFLVMSKEIKIDQYLNMNILEFIIVELAHALADKFLLEILKSGVLSEFIKKFGNEFLQVALKRQSEEIILTLIDAGCKANKETLHELKKTLGHFNLPESKIQEIIQIVNAANPVSLNFLMRRYVNKNFKYMDLPEEIRNSCIIDFLNYEHS